MVMVSDDFGEFHLFDFKITGFIWLSPLFCDIWRIFKTERVNYQVKMEQEYLIREGPQWRFFFHWWTPVWHEKRGPYINIILGPLHLMRGY